MRDVNINHSYAVFKTFSVEPNINNEICEKESYIPYFFVLIAAREMGYYPSSSQIESFLTRIPSSSDGGIYFSQFLQLCEELVDTRDMCMAAVHQFAYELENKNGSSIFTTKELIGTLNSPASSMSQQEIEAVIRLLDPKQTNHVSLEALVIVLMRHQRPLGEMPCRDIISRGTDVQLVKSEHSVIPFSQLSKDSFNSNNANVFELSPSSIHKASYLSIMPPNHKKVIHHMDAQESENDHNLQHTDLYSHIASHVDLKASSTSKHHFVRSPTDMNMTVDPSTGSQKLQRNTGGSNLKKNGNIPISSSLSEANTNTLNNLRKDRNHNSPSTRRICDLSGNASTLGTPSTSKGKNYELLTKKTKDNRPSCCIIC
ncbi:unnamed protein product [Phytomonas sp. Hart1]|nr:unnamed protein product [Phytomonas sp. Hart1]|eukprot:CCW69387.1 unnamed protein product [Phytomonas sp. isolate Hart1]